MERLLTAAESLLETRHWDSITVAEIVQRARSSVGSFYARFRDKDAMLHYLDSRNLSEMGATIADGLRPDRWKGAGLAPRIDALVRALIEIHRRKRGLLRALMLVARLRPDEKFAEIGGRALRRIDDVAAFLLECRDEISHPDPDHAVRFAFVLALNGAREAVLFPESPSGELHRDDEHLADELSRAAQRYLGLEPPPTKEEDS